MAAHIIQKSGRGGVWYLIDGYTSRSLKTKKKKYAEFLLEQYIKGKLGIRQSPTVQMFFHTWIPTKQEPLYRKSYIRDKWQHFRKYILPAHGDLRLCDVGAAELEAFRIKLLKKLSVKTVRNIIDASYRAMYRDARAQKLADGDPFEALEWPEAEREAPDPFHIQEMSLILAGFKKLEPFYFPLVLHQFETGMRPSETEAMLVKRVSDGKILVLKSRHLKSTANTKTKHSRRSIGISRSHEALLRSIRLPWQQDDAQLFYNKFGDPLNVNNWAKDYWAPMLERLGIRWHKFYATRHTSITERIKAGYPIAAVAQYHGTSVQMIEENYLGKLDLVAPEVRRTAELSKQELASPTGFEPVGLFSDKLQQLVTTEIAKFRRDRRAG